MWYAVVIVVDIEGFYIFNMCDNNKVMCVGGQNTVDGKDNQEKEVIDVSDISVISVRV